MASIAAPVYRSQGNNPFRSERQNSQLKRGQTVPYDVNGAPAGGVPDTRLINTTAPLTGGGALSSDLTIAISAATSGAAGSMSAADKTKLDAISGTNTGDQTSIVGITGTLAQFNTALTGADFASGGGTATGTNTGDQFTAMTSSRILGRKTAGFGAAEELNGTDATSLLDSFAGSLKGLVPASAGGTSNFLRADGSWAPASGTGTLIRSAMIYLNTAVAGGNAVFATTSWLASDFNETWDPLDGGNVQRCWLGASFTFATTDVTTGTDTITKTGHGMITGEGPTFFTSSTTLPAGLSAATKYWIIRVDNDNFKLATSRANAIANTPVDITSQGTGTHTCNRGEYIVVPKGVTRMEVSTGCADNSDLTGQLVLQILKAGSTAYVGYAAQGVDTAGVENAQVSGGPFGVVEGDYFTVQNFGSDAWTMIANGTWVSVKMWS